MNETRMTYRKDAEKVGHLIPIKKLLNNQILDCTINHKIPGFKITGNSSLSPRISKDLTQHGKKELTIETIDNKNLTKSSDPFYNKDDDRVNENWNFSNISSELSTMEKIKYFSLFKKTSMKKIGGSNNKISTNNTKDLIILDDFKISNYKIDQNFEEILFEKYYFECIVNNAGLYCIKRAAPFMFLISLLLVFQKVLLI